MCQPVIARTRRRTAATKQEFRSDARNSFFAFALAAVIVGAAVVCRPKDNAAHRAIGCLSRRGLAAGERQRTDRL
jgi:hypothetical protein